MKCLQKSNIDVGERENNKRRIIRGKTMVRRNQDKLKKERRRIRRVTHMTAY